MFAPLLNAEALCTDEDKIYLTLDLLANGVPSKNIDQALADQCRAIEERIAHSKFIQDLGQDLIKDIQKVRDDFLMRLSKMEEPDSFNEALQDLRSARGALVKAIGKDIFCTLTMGIKAWTDRKGISQPATPLKDYLNNVFKVCSQGVPFNQSDYVQLDAFLATIAQATQQGVTFIQQEERALQALGNSQDYWIMQRIYEQMRIRIYSLQQTAGRCMNDIKQQDFESSKYLLQILNFLADAFAQEIQSAGR